MEIYKLCGAVIAAVIMTVTVRQLRAEIAPLLTVAVTVIVMCAAVSTLAPIIELSVGAASDGLTSNYAEPLVKSLGIAVLTGCAAGICRDCGESSVAAAVELAGKAEILALSVPLMRELLSLAKNMLP